MADTIVDMLRNHDHALALRAAVLKGQSAMLNTLPAQPAFLAELEQELVVSSIHASAAIAGSPMRLRDVRAELARSPETPEPPSGPTVARARRIVANLGLAYDPLPIGRTEEAVFGISSGFVNKVQAVLAQGEPPLATGEAGRSQPEMLQLITWANGPEFTVEASLLRAALFHYGVLRLHPFAQANGRVARFFETSILTVAGVRFVSLMMPEFYLDNVDEYLSFFRADSERSSSDFLKFFLRGAELGLGRVREQILDPLRTLALAAYFEELRDKKQIKSRLFELLHLLLHHSGPFRLKDLFLCQPFKLLYNHVSEHTARRDLKKLMALDLLHKDDLWYTFHRDLLG